MARLVAWAGKIPPTALARVCAWCTRPVSERDRRLKDRGAEITHSICGECAQAYIDEHPQVH